MSASVKSSVNLEWALYYATTRGWNVFPLNGELKKAHTWKGLKYGPERWGATKDPATIRANFTEYPLAGIGLPTGVDNGFWVIETDTKNGKAGEAELAKLPALPDTYRVRSPSGSIHYYFQHPGLDYYIKSTANEVASGIDVKGDGGMVVAPPTERSDKRYEIVNNVIIAEAPDWLLARVARKLTDVEKGFVRNAPPTDDPAVDQAAIAKLESWVQQALALPAGEAWFAVRENALGATWGIKRAGYGREGYRIADIFCSHFAETQHVHRVDRFWNDKGANSGTISLDSFWGMCRDIGIKNTPEELYEWHAEKGRAAAEALNAAASAITGLPAVSSPPIAAALPPPPGKAPVTTIRTISAASFAGRPAPEREELVSGLIPAKIIGGLYGDGAVGKSLLAMMLGVSVVTGRSWLNRIVRKGPVVYVCCEDDEAEVHRRLENICREMNVDMATLGDFHIVPLVDEDSVLASSDGRSNVLTTTPLYGQLVSLANDIKPQLLIGDTLNDIFAGSENDRMQAKQFVKLMRPLVIPHGGTGLILAHPSVDGMRSGRGTSGTTGWNNSFRWRGYLDKVLDESGNEPDPTRRVLRTKKLNYGPQGGEIELRYHNGCYRLGFQESTMGDPMAKAARADRVFVDLLRKHLAQNNHVSVQERGGCYAPKVFAREAAAQGVNRIELRDAMQRLIDSHRIENAPFGSPSKNQYRLHIEPLKQPVPGDLC